MFYSVGLIQFVQVVSGFSQASASGDADRDFEFEERIYLFLTLPNSSGKQQFKVSGERCYALWPAVLKR